MAAIKFSGKTLANQIYHNLSSEVANVLKNGIKPHLAIVRVGNDEAAALYADVKCKKAEKLAISTSCIALPQDVSPKEFSSCLNALNADSAIKAILVEAPLPAPLLPYLQIAKEKDVDGASGGALFAPCTAMAAFNIIKESGAMIDGAKAVVIGRSAVVGRPLAQLLLSANATVTVCHSHTKDLAFYTQAADILISATGRPNLISGAMVKEGAVLIDVGTTQTAGGLVGDFQESAYEKAAFYTPVPGGVGPVTTAMLLSNVVKAAKLQAGIIKEDKL